jgi:hypothetical protein
MSKHKVAVLGILALVALTGCIGGLGGDGDGGGNGGDVTAAGNTTTVAVAVGLDTQAQQDLSGMLNQSEQRLLQRAQFAPGNLSTAEQQRAQQLQQEIQQAQQEAANQSASDFESAVESTQTLAVEGSIQQGSTSLYLVSGSPSEVVGLLNQSNVQAIASQEQYNQLQQQQQQAPAPGGAPGGAPAP